MINYIVPLVATMRPMWGYVLTLILALAFVATVPVIVRKVVSIFV